MGTPFWPATADQVVDVVEAVIVNNNNADIAFVARFADLTQEQAEKALKLSIDIGLLAETSALFISNSPLCKFFITPKEEQKVAVLRIIVESYKPFVVFRERLIATDDARKATRDTKRILDLDIEEVELKDTLISLGTYSDALITERGGKYTTKESPYDNILQIVAVGCENLVAAEARIREQIGEEAAAFVSREEVIVPLANSLQKAMAGASGEAVTSAGNAIDSFLDCVARKVNVIFPKPGINNKLNELRSRSKLPIKLQNVGFYLGHIRNAADHGIDKDIGKSWKIRENTGLEYVFVACSFIASLSAFEIRNSGEI